ncbi:MAG TPA: PAS domain S-box protein [Janthinobacterium sp.]|nr:PAS domain S-box protein [Janthinobacterium sp.]
MNLSTFILENVETILQEWEEFAASLYSGIAKLDSATLRDHARQMLITIAADLARPETPYQQHEKAQGRGVDGLGVTAASEHGAGRQLEGFSLDATVAEYRALRASVTRLWQQAHGELALSVAAVNDMVRFNEAIDQAIGESVVSYAALTDLQTRVFDAILSSSPDLSFTFDLACVCTYANKATVELLERPLERIVGADCDNMGLEAEPGLRDQIARVINSAAPVQGEMSARGSSGQRHLYEYILVPVNGKNGAVASLACTARNITERKAAENENWKSANYDILTGLPNRRLFLDRLHHDLAHALRVGATLALMFIDLDRFKEVNDGLGHDAGDLLLQLVAGRVRSCLRESDTVARLGGDEFTVILQDPRDPEHVELAVRKILKELGQPFQLGQQWAHISASIGVTLAPQDADALQALIDNADHAMYLAKAAGRNRFAFFSKPSPPSPPDLPAPRADAR